MQTEDIESRFSFHPAKTEHARDSHECVRSECKRLATLFNEFLPEGREKSVAITKLEEVMFWANASIARDGAV